MKVFTPWFPEAGNYIKYFDSRTKEYKYRRLLWKRDPFVYPKRLPSVAAAAKGDTYAFQGLNPSETKKHIYLAYLGVRPGFLYYLWHPYDIKNLKWDEIANLDITEDQSANISYETSPYEYPTKAIGIEHDRYPSVQALNIQGVASHPEVGWVASLYVVKEHKDLDPEEINSILSGKVRAYPWDFGGEL